MMDENNWIKKGKNLLFILAGVISIVAVILIYVYDTEDGTLGITAGEFSRTLQQIPLTVKMVVMGLLFGLGLAIINSASRKN